MDRHIISLGAGVQSSVMLLMGERGDIEPRPEAAVFADTQWEPQDVYEHLDWLESQVSIPIHRITGGDIRGTNSGAEVADEHIGRKKPYPSMPLFTGDGGLATRECTRDYKIAPILRAVREIIGYPGRASIPKDLVVRQWIGISLDEVVRMKVSRRRWTKFRYPLVELGMRRHDCLTWFGEHYPGRSLPRSACVACPYHNDHEWRRIRDEHPKAWDEAVAFDKQLRVVYPDRDYYVHRALVPLDEVDLRTDEELGQMNFFASECEGMCGV